MLQAMRALTGHAKRPQLIRMEDQMFFQNCEWLPERIQLIGCEFLAWIAALCHYTRQELAVSDLHTVYERAKDFGYWDDTKGLNTALSYRGVAVIFANYFANTNLRGDQIGIIDGPDRRYWNWVKHPHTVYVIERYQTKGPDTHSILLTSSFKTIYNPAPEKELLGVDSALLYFVGPVSEWDRMISNY